ncbi:EAL domain-containing protein [Pseudomonas sp. RC4D1]|uniref:EAL domain-containing protein n=1 Tax=Pseudomonas sp. RC4D1 TaxID=2834407 RepID=UPI0032DE91D1
MLFGILVLIYFLPVLLVLAVCKFVKFFYVNNFSTESSFARALANNELSVSYQPIVDVATGMWVGAEALIRWGKASPELFIPVIERGKLIKSTTRWVCRKVIEDHSHSVWACDDFYISINLSAQDVLDLSFPSFIEQLLCLHNIPASRIMFEVTEGVLLDQQVAVQQLDLLRRKGHKIALDDFGTGYSNLSYLDNLPLDMIKVDRSFVVKLDASSSTVVLTHILKLSLHLRLKVIFEGVENVDQVERLTALGASTVQGWFYSKDLTVEELVRGYFSLAHPNLNRII